MSLTIEIPAGSPYLAGHFPGRPILPGVAQLAFACDALRPAGVRHVVLARFRRLVTPPARLSIQPRTAHAGAVRVDVASELGLVSSIEVVPGIPEPAGDWRVGIASRRASSAVPLEELLPHRAPMRFVDGIAGEAEDGLSCTARIPEACALVRDGVAPAVVALEAAAQTAAVWEALRSLRSGGAGSHMGFLVSARDVELHAATVPAEATLLASVRLVAHAGPLAHYRVEVSHETQPLLRGTIGAYREEAALSGQSSRKQNH